MATYTNLGIQQIVTGTEAGTWGIITNTNFDYFDSAIVGYSLVTLTTAGTSGSPNTTAIQVIDYTASAGRSRILEVYSASDLGATAYIQINPNDFAGYYFIKNSLAGNRDLVLFQGTYSAPNSITLTNGASTVIRCDGGGATAIVTRVLDTFQGTKALFATSVGIGTTSPTNALSFGGNSARTIWLERNTTANTAGSNLTVQAGGATTSASDKNGGNLLLSSGTSTGTGTSIITFSTAISGGSSGTSDNAPAERMRINSAGNVGIGTASPDALLSVNGIASFGDGAVATPSITHFGDLDTGFWFPAVNTIAASTNGAEQFRIGSTGQVNIGAAGANNANDIFQIGAASTVLSASTSTSVSGIGLRFTYPNTAQTAQHGILIAVNGGDKGTAYTTTDVFGLLINAYTLGTNQTVTTGTGIQVGAPAGGTTNYGVRINAISSATTNYGVLSSSTIGTGRFNFYEIGRAHV